MMRLMSRQMQMMRRNVVILAIQRKNNIHRRKRKTMWVYPRPQFWNCKTVKKLGSVLQLVSQGFVPKKPRGERLENNFARLFGRHLSLNAIRLAAVFVGTS